MEGSPENFVFRRRDGGKRLSRGGEMGWGVGGAAPNEAFAPGGSKSSERGSKSRYGGRQKLVRGSD